MSWFLRKTNVNAHLSLANLGGVERVTLPWSVFLLFSFGFQKNGPNNRLAPLWLKENLFYPYSTIGIGISQTGGGKKGRKEERKKCNSTESHPCGGKVLKTTVNATFVDLGPTVSRKPLHFRNFCSSYSSE